MVKEGDFPKKVKITPRRIVFMKNDVEDWIKSKKITTIFQKNKGGMCLPLSSLELLFLNEWCFEVPVNPIFFLVLLNKEI